MKNESVDGHQWKYEQQVRLSKMSLVGQTEDLQTFADKLLQVMSLEPGSVVLPHDRPTLQKYVANLTQQDFACFSRSNHLDDALWRSLASLSDTEML